MDVNCQLTSLPPQVAEVDTVDEVDEDMHGMVERQRLVQPHHRVHLGGIGFEASRRHQARQATLPPLLTVGLDP